MKMDDVLKVVELNSEMENVRNMLEVMEDNHNHYLEVCVSTTYVCHSNESCLTNSSRVIDLFEEALRKALNEIEKEIELI